MASYKKPKKKLSAGEEQTLAKRQWEAYSRARDHGHLDYVEMAQQCDAFYRGEQWDEADISALDDQGRPALTINTILPTVNTVLGEQSTRRADVQFKPRGNGNQETADVLSRLYMQIADNNKLEWLESQAMTPYKGSVQPFSLIEHLEAGTSFLTKHLALKCSYLSLTSS